MLVKIYLNDGEDHFFGFKNEFANAPELTMVHSFEITETEHAWVHGLLSCLNSINPVLSWIFIELNIGGGSVAKAYRAKMLRSLSVGDVVSIGETAWSCDNFGWSIITTEELNNAIIWNDEIDKV